MKRVVSIAFDGLEPTIVRRLLAAGQLPNFARLREMGGESDLGTTYPAQTPVAFATFSTGTNPGGHGIFDFLRRNPATYLPDQSLNRYEQTSRFLPPKVVNLRGGATVWQCLTEAGIPSAILRAPCTYGPDALEGRMLSGLGVPDLRGGLGTPAFFTTDAAAVRQQDEHLIPVEIRPDGTAQTWIIGPRNPKTREDCRVEATIRIEADKKQVVIEPASQPSRLIVREGQWSEWLRLKFKLGFLQAVYGIVRFYLVRTESPLELYASPVHFDPDTPLFPISAPPEYSRELAGELGPFYTAGMIEEHTGLNNGRIGEDAFLAQCDDVWREREAMLFYELDRQREGLIFCLFDTSDRIQHMFWRHTEPDHPANRGKPCTQWTQAIDDAYRRCDAILGRVMQRIDGDTLLMAFSDHGFGSFRRGVHLNAWLRDRKLLCVKPGVDPAGGLDMLRDVDWSHTKAYQIGLSGIYLNLKGREAEGIVTTDDASRVEAEIIAGLAEARDPATGTAGVRSVLRRDQIYSGPYSAGSPDLVVNCEKNYRISWNSARGCVLGEQFEDNEKRWSGDHIIDPALVPGILFMNRPFRRRKTDLRDLAPTILTALGAPIGKAMEGASLVDEDSSHRS